MKFVCSLCGYSYVETAGVPEQGIIANTLWSDIPTVFVCPVCGADKDAFSEEIIM